MAEGKPDDASRVFDAKTREMIYLDTSFLIGSLAPSSPESTRLKEWLRAGEKVETSVISWAEFICGPLNPSQIAMLERIIGEPIPFTRSDAETAARLFNETGRKRGTFVDCMIASSALAAGAAVATSNLEDFVRFRSSGLHVEQV